MPLTKTTVRAFAASIVIVAAGATVAGAAVFHLPILGFHRAGAASATVSPASVKHAAVAARKPRPRVVIKTRYVDDIVHRRAPSSGYDAQGSSAPANVSLASTSAPASTQPPAASSTIAPSPVARTQTPPATWTDDHEYGDESGRAGAPAEDQ